MPTRFPNLLVNGSAGIAVGMATNIPPHNLSEVVDALIALIDDPQIDIDGLMEHIPGPDFPTAGIIRSEEHTSELQSLMRISYAVFCLKNNKFYYMQTPNLTST